MTIKAELILFLVSMASSTAAAMIFVWKIGLAVAGMKATLKEQIANANFDRKLNDERLEHLQDELELGFNGLREKFEHFSTRSRSESSELSKRLESVENFLVKTTEFEKR